LLDFVLENCRWAAAGPAPRSVFVIPISSREYDTYRRTVKVLKGLIHGETEGCRANQVSQVDTKSRAKTSLG
jgi:hypothetical protein